MVNTPSSVDQFRSFFLLEPSFESSFVHLKTRGMASIYINLENRDSKQFVSDSSCQISKTKHF